MFVLYESPHRIVDLTAELAELWPESRLCVCSDLTKRYERIYRGSAPEVLTALRGNPSADKGEYCAVVDLSALPPMEEPKAPALSAELFLMSRVLEGDDLRQAMDAAREQGYPRNELYRAKLKLEELFEEE